jgi:hypothetical protein
LFQYFINFVINEKSKRAYDILLSIYGTCRHPCAKTVI